MTDWRNATCNECGAKCHEGETHLQHNAGWRMKVLSWDFSDIQMKNYPGWETKEQGGGWGMRPPYVELRHINGKGKSSEEVQLEWDDIARCKFYSRDISDDGSCCVAKGDGYGSAWYFQKRDDAVAFAKKYGGCVQ